MEAVGMIAAVGLDCGSRTPKRERPSARMDERQRVCKDCTSSNLQHRQNSPSRPA